MVQVVGKLLISMTSRSLSNTKNLRILIHEVSSAFTPDSFYFMDHKIVEIGCVLSTIPQI